MILHYILTVINRIVTSLQSEILIWNCLVKDDESEVN